MCDARARAVPLVLAAIALLVSCTGGTIDDALVTGTVELRETEVAPQVGGEVTRVLVAEGDVVRRGDTLLVLASLSLPGELAARSAQVARARADLADLQRGPRTDEVRRADSERAAIGAEAARLARDATRLEALLAEGAVSRSQAEQVRAAARQAAARESAAASATRLVRAGPREHAIAGARARLAETEAALATSRAAAAELAVTAPVDGIITVRAVESGEILQPGQPAMIIADQRAPWVRVYVNQRDLPFVKVGAAVEARLDGAPDRPLAGRVTGVSPRAEFTPRVALTEDERADMLFGVRITLDDPGGLLKAGLPVTVRLPRGATRSAR